MIIFSLKNSIINYWTWTLGTKLCRVSMLRDSLWSPEPAKLPQEAELYSCSVIPKQGAKRRLNVVVDWPPSCGTIIERAGFKLNYKNTMITHFCCFKILHFNNQIHSDSLDSCSLYKSWTCTGLVHRDIKINIRWVFCATVGKIWHRH